MKYTMISSLMATVLSCALFVWTAYAQESAKEFRVVKVASPFDMGYNKRSKEREVVKDYYVSMGSQDNLQMKSTLNVYRKKEIESPFGGEEKTEILIFVGKMTVIYLQSDYAIGRVTSLTTEQHPMLKYNTVMIGDYIMPVFTIDSDVLFEVGKSVLRSEAAGELQRTAEFIRQYSPSQVSIEGHTDSGGTDEYNYTLSEQRAQSVKNYLVQKEGISETILVAKGYGESRPIAPNDTPEGRALNRRVEIILGEE